MSLTGGGGVYRNVELLGEGVGLWVSVEVEKRSKEREGGCRREEL